MKILVSSIFFYPEHSGSAPYSTDSAVYFAERGHEVTVVTGFPFYPSWEKRPDDHRKLLEVSEYKGVKVLRGYLYVPKNPTALKRLLHEVTFTVVACLNFLRAGRHNCIVLSAAPILMGLVGVVFKSLWKAQLVIHVQDLQSDAALSLGGVKYNFLVKLLMRLETLFYKHASWVATITPNMKEKLRQKGLAECKLAVYPNWIDVTNITKVYKRNSRGNFVSKHPIARGKFIAAYAGNMGAKQDLEALVDLARASQSYQDMHYFIVGEGSHRLQVEEYAKGKELTNLTFLPFMSPESYFEMLQDIDVSFVSQKTGTGDVFFPGKLLGIMAMSKPLLVSADLDSELATVIAGVECGLVSKPGDLNSLLHNVLTLYEKPSLRETFGHNGYRHVINYDRERVLSQFLDRICRWSRSSPFS
jgi:colanic acid biosynthesis glycosyl transferase WcaI